MVPCLALVHKMTRVQVTAPGYRLLKVKGLDFVGLARQEARQAYLRRRRDIDVEFFEHLQFQFGKAPRDYTGIFPRCV